LRGHVGNFIYILYEKELRRINPIFNTSSMWGIMLSFIFSLKMNANDDITKTAGKNRLFQVTPN